ncbi:MAG: dnaQ [Gammaproteobacteria bacterium]|jgi:DNA polymerase-3 subunit epsilon|nr:dnaQ [Gammaproteobacteria bacterium]
MRQVVLDTETTGLHTTDNHRIIEIACVELINRKCTGNRYHRYINPQREIDAEAQSIHGLSIEFLKDKPLFKDILEELMDFLKGAELIIHNAPFDVGFINYELSLAKKKWKLLTDHCHIIDTLALARQLHVGQRNSLDALCKRYKIDNSHRELHGALLDAQLLAQVYLAMTGGQGSLFDTLDVVEAEPSEASNARIPLKKVRNLIVLQATATELIAHQEHPGVS